MAIYPCSDDPNEVIGEISGAGESAEKFNKFVNGTQYETVQLGTGSPTPTVRNVVRLMKSAAAEIDGSDVSGKFALVNGGTELRMLADKLEDSVTPKDFGAAGDGTTDDSAAFAALEDAFSGRCIDLLGQTYAVDSLPSGNYYYNGGFVVDESWTTPANGPLLVHNNPAGITGKGVDRTDSTYFFCGPQFTELSIAYGKYPASLFGSAFSWGAGNFQKNIENEQGFSAIAIGPGIMSENVMTGSHNIGVGDFALHSLSSGDRNIAIGSLAFFNAETLYQSTAIGRDAGQCFKDGYSNICIGYRCIGGDAPICLDGGIHASYDIENAYQNVAIGNSAMQFLSAYDESYNNVCIGHRAGQELKSAFRNVVIGANNSRLAQSGTSYNGKLLVKVEETATYTSSGTTITVSKSGHSAVAGRYVEISFTSGACYEASSARQVLYVDSVSETAFTLTSPASIAGSGSCTIYSYEQDTDYSGSFNGNVCIGANSLVYADNIEKSVVVGDTSCSSNELTEVKFSVVIGQNSESSAKKLNNAICIGWASGTTGTADVSNVSIGYIAGAANAGGETCIHNTAIGHQALSAMQGGGTSDSLVNATGVGYNARVSGSNQIQLGNSETSVYCYGSVQNRSDGRDKTDVRNTRLGLDFLLSLRPVDFKWDYREDYVETVEHEVETVDSEGNSAIEVETEVVRHEKDGSRKRNRYHHGLIAQEVKAVLDSRGIDFGGYQDHRINGGEDVLSLGYEEFIAPIIRAIQEIDARLSALEA